VTTDKILERFHQIQWRYAPHDHRAAAELSRRIVNTAHRGSLITYSDLVRDITFRLPGLEEPERKIDVSDWEDLDRAILGDFLGYLSMESYEEGGFFCSALVVSKNDGTPGEGFYNLLRELGLIAGSKTDKAMLIWVDHVAKAHKYYGER
jgi:hypothetical protein